MREVSRRNATQQSFPRCPGFMPGAFGRSVQEDRGAAEGTGTARATAAGRARGHAAGRAAAGARAAGRCRAATGAAAAVQGHREAHRSEEYTSELQSLMRISYAVFCLKKKKTKTTLQKLTTQT